ncbi:MAG: hypothetical protein BRD50_03575 [Bacteroidetes bacterium SW_11_45_7]|nr:MAG: hypothetical protein BRD50_03575 [Bacteroidetes bacterium SW_11_45_7]
MKVSLNDLQRDDVIELVKKARQRVHLKKQLQRKPAGQFNDDDLEAEKGQEVFVNYEAMLNSFLASGRDLMDFINQYPLPGKPGFAERLNIYCRIIALFPQDIEITDRFNRSQGVEYALAFPVDTTQTN